MAEKSLNRVELIGRLGKDAETAFTKNGKAVTKFSIATENRWKDASGEWKSSTSWHNCVLWSMEKVAEYLTKGTRVFVAGRLETRNYEKDGKKVYVTEVIGEDIILLGSKDGGTGGGMQSVPRGAAAPAAKADDPASWGAPPSGIDDGDVPF